MKTLIAASISALVLAACASDPAPRPAANAYAEGYTEHALSTNRYLVEYRMEGGDYQRAVELALWRAAQITLQHGYSSFEVVNRDTATDPGARATTSLATQHAVSYQRSCGLLSCTTTATPVTWAGVQMNTDGRRPSRVASLEIVLGNGPVAGSPNRYLASDVISNLRDR